MTGSAVEDRVAAKDGKGWRKVLFEVIFEADTVAGKWFDVILILSIVASVIVVMLKSMKGVSDQYGGLLGGLEWFFTVLFTVEYVLRLACLNRPTRYARSFFGVVDLLAIQKEIHAGIFAVMDGTICGSGPGPRTMVPVRGDLLLASSDSVAIDATAAKIMGFDPMSLPYIRLAHERGLGVGRIEEIEIKGEDIRELNLNFPVGDNLASKVGDLLWFSPLKVFQRLLFRAPLVYSFIFGSYLYHDHYWWPRHGKPLVRRMGTEDPWGRLFAQYRE